MTTISAFILLISLFTPFCHSLQSYCSTQNTAQTNSNYSLYQSNGLCTDYCLGYALAIVQNHLCWCSNDLPALQADTSDCESACPGYPYDLCGNEDEGLFGYILLSNPTATVDGVSSTSSDEATETTSATQDDTSTISTSSTSRSTSSTSTTPTSPTSSTEDTTSSTIAPTPSTSSSSTSSTDITSSDTTTSDSTSSDITSTTSSDPVSSSVTSSITTSSQITSTASSAGIESLRTTNSIASSTILASSSAAYSSSSYIISSSTRSTYSSASSVPITSKPVTVYRVTTVTGQEVTQTLTEHEIMTLSASSLNNNGQQSRSSDSNGSSFWDSKGKVAGVFVVVAIVLIVLILTIAWFCCFRNRYRDSDDDVETDVYDAYEKDHRNSLITLDGDTMVRQNHQRNASVAGGNVVVDQRLNPFLFVRDDGDDDQDALSGSFINDGNDYSRRFYKVTNPD